MPAAKFFKISSIFALLPFIFQLPPTKNFLSIVNFSTAVQINWRQKYTLVQMDGEERRKEERRGTRRGPRTG